MKNKALLKITAAVLCLILTACVFISCGKNKTEDTDAPTEAPTNEATEPSGNATDTVNDNDDAEDIGEAVVLPLVIF